MENATIESLADESENASHPAGIGFGCQQKHVATALGVSETTLSRMFPKGFAKEIAKIVDRRGGAGTDA